MSSKTKDSKLPLVAESSKGLLSRIGFSPTVAYLRPITRKKVKVSRLSGEYVIIMHVWGIG